MKTRLASILGILALTCGSVALAQPQPVQRGVESSVTGTVVSSSGTSLVIRTDNGAEQSFDVDTSSTIPTGLTPGSRITVRYHTLEGGRRHAASVMRSDASEEAKLDPIKPELKRSFASSSTETAPVTAPTTSLTAPTTPDTIPTTPVMPPPPTLVMTPTTPDLAPAPESLMTADINAGDRLPETASEMPMLALAGLMTIAAGLVLRELRRRDA